MSQHHDPAFCAALGKQWIDAWNSHDLERILALYSDDSEMTSDKIPLLGLDPTGTQRITPPQTTSYILTASGPGGDASRTATVTVTGPAPPPVTNMNPPRRGGTLLYRKDRVVLPDEQVPT